MCEAETCTTFIRKQNAEFMSLVEDRLFRFRQIGRQRGQRWPLINPTWIMVGGSFYEVEDPPLFYVVCHLDDASMTRGVRVVSLNLTYLARMYDFHDCKSSRENWRYYKIASSVKMIASIIPFHVFVRPWFIFLQNGSTTLKNQPAVIKQFKQ